MRPIFANSEHVAILLNPQRGGGVPVNINRDGAARMYRFRARETAPRGPGRTESNGGETIGFDYELVALVDKGACPTVIGRGVRGQSVRRPIDVPMHLSIDWAMGHANR